jgi:hypothetical protein
MEFQGADLVETCKKVHNTIASKLFLNLLDSVSELKMDVSKA